MTQFAGQGVKEANTGLDLRDATALISGSGRGIGLAVAQLLSRSGARVALHDISQDRLDGAMAQLRGEGHQPVKFVGDACDEQDVEAVVENCLKSFGRLDILVNAVGGLVEEPKDIVDVSLSTFESTIGLNLFSAVLFTKHVVPMMKRQGGGRIISISSALALRGNKNSHVGYDSGKGAVCGLTRALALELADFGILVNAVAPSNTLTESTVEAGLDDASLYDSYPLRRAATPMEIAGAVTFLASGWASYITGETLVVTGAQFIGSSQV